MNGYHSEEDMLRSMKNMAVEWYVDPDRYHQFNEMLEKDGRVTEFESEVYRHLTRERIWVSESAWTVRNPDGAVTGYEGTVVEITERKKLESLVAHAANHDALTGLPNRALFNQVLEDVLTSGELFFLAYLDLDGFKKVNDTYGHGIGDDLLVAIAGRFKNAFRIDEPVFRIGGDEFAIIMTNCTREQVSLRLDRLIHAFELPFKLRGMSMKITVSVGVAASSQGIKASDILNLADIEMYRAKLTKC